ncbi:hypothetical protein TIFTF001_016382 [Ficus carica]|uniref:Uncharacterized protein n=1 Tax=Ficus carica TaxID=3494 RepID=A0AA88D9U6_FICCA|nr:hypothetical protein TIFTF001_016382 [Ficus carica]
MTTLRRPPSHDVDAPQTPTRSGFGGGGGIGLVGVERVEGVGRRRERAGPLASGGRRPGSVASGGEGMGVSF